MSKKKTVLVTGGAGFIGSHLCDRLLDLGHKVICVDNFDNYYPAEYKRQNIESALKNPNFTFYEIDITNYERIAPIFELYKIDVIAHLAGRGGVPASVERPLFYVHTNVHGTLCMLEAARHYKVPQFIFASSSSVYGASSKIPFSEDDPTLQQVSPYGATKKAAELLVQTYHHLYGIHATILRFFTAYGPRTRPDMALNKFTEKIIAGEELTAFKGMRRDFTYIDDIIIGLVAAINKNLSCEIINLGNSDSIPVRRYIQAVENALGIKAKVVEKDPNPGELLETMAAIDKGEKLLGYNPKTKVETGVANFIQWYKANRQGKTQSSKSHKPVKVIAFDFDGTIVNVEKGKSVIFGEIVEKYWRGNKKDAAKFYFNITGPARKAKFDFYYRKLFNKSLPTEEYNRIERAFSARLYSELYPRLKPLIGAIDLLKFCRAHFDKVYVTSAVPQTEIKYIVKKIKATKYFDHIFGTDTRYPSKLTMFEEIAREENPAIMFFVTDSELDLKTAREMGIISIAIPTNRPAVKLKSAGANYVAEVKKCPGIIKRAIGAS